MTEIILYSPELDVLTLMIVDELIPTQFFWSFEQAKEMADICGNPLQIDPMQEFNWVYIGEL